MNKYRFFFIFFCVNRFQLLASLYHFASVECSIVFVPCDSGLLILKHCGGTQGNWGNSSHCSSFHPAHTKVLFIILIGVALISPKGI